MLSTFTALLSAAGAVNALATSRIPTSQPAYAVDLPKDLLGISIESAVFDEWSGRTGPNQFVHQTLGNLAALTGQAIPIRIGGTPQDDTYLVWDGSLDANKTYINATFPPATDSNFYPAASHVGISPKAAELCGNFPKGTKITWGLNFRALNKTETVEQAKAVYAAFNSRAAKNRVYLERLELGNEPDFFGVSFLTGQDPPANLVGWNMARNSAAWAEFTNAIVSAVDKASFMFGSFAQYGTKWSWNIEQSLASNGFWETNLAKSISAYSQHLYFGAFLGVGRSPTAGYLLNRDQIRGNVSALAAGVPLLKNYGIRAIMGETNSAARHGIPGVSDTAEAAIWLVDYVLQLAFQGISRVHLHNGVGYHYALIQPVAISVGPKAAPAPKIQAPYWGAYIANEFVGSEKDTKIIELSSTADNTAGYAVFANGKAKRALFINYDKYFEGNATATRSSQTVSLDGFNWQGVSVKRFVTPFTGSLEGFTWGGLSLESPSGAVSGKPVSEQLTSSNFTINASEVVMLTLPN